MINPARFAAVMLLGSIAFHTGAQTKPSGDSGIQKENPPQEAALATLKGGGGCVHDKHGDLKCYHFHLAGTDTPIVSHIDGKGPDGFGRKGATFNGGGWNEGFALKVPAGPHTVTVSYNWEGVYGYVYLPNGYIWAQLGSNDKTVSFNTEPGHTYTINEITNPDRSWQPIILDVTSKQSRQVDAQVK